MSDASGPTPFSHNVTVFWERKVQLWKRSTEECALKWIHTIHMHKVKSSRLYDWYRSHRSAWTEHGKPIQCREEPGSRGTGSEGHPERSLCLFQPQAEEAYCKCIPFSSRTTLGLAYCLAGLRGLVCELWIFDGVNRRCLAGFSLYICATLILWCVDQRQLFFFLVSAGANWCLFYLIIQNTALVKFVSNITKDININTSKVLIKQQLWK